MKRILSAQDHARFLRDGWLVVRGAVPPAKVAAALAAAEAAVARRAAGDRFVSGPVFEACLTPALRRAFAELLGPGGLEKGGRVIDEPRVRRPAAFWSEPRAHTDVDHPCVAPDDWALGALVFLTRVRPRGGAFVGFPGSHARLLRLAASDPGRLKELEGRPEHSGAWEELLAEPGDAVIFHHLFGHCGTENVSSDQTRHALLFRARPRRRPLPGGAGTAEKSYAAAAAAGPRLEPASRLDAALSAGAHPGGLLAHDELREAGLTRRFFVEARAPGRVRQTAGKGWLDGDERPALDLPGEVIRSLSVFRHGPEALLLAAVGGDDSPSVRVFSSADLDAWTELPALRARAASAFTADAYGAPDGRGLLVAGAAGGAPEERRGAEWREALSAAPVPAAPAPDGWELQEASLRPVRGERAAALTADARPAGGGETRLLWTSRTPERAPAPWRPLGGPKGASQLRVYARARGWWLVSFLAPAADGRRLFWGEVDWERPRPVLRPLRTRAALARALRLAGLLAAPGAEKL